MRSIGRLTASGGMCASDESGSCEAVRALCEEYREANSKRVYVCKYDAGYNGTVNMSMNCMYARITVNTNYTILSIFLTYT